MLDVLLKFLSIIDASLSSLTSNRDNNKLSTIIVKSGNCFLYIGRVKPFSIDIISLEERETEALPIEGTLTDAVTF